ncbi:MAG: nitroreductase family protein [Anaerolineae bacterium]
MSRERFERLITSEKNADAVIEIAQRFYLDMKRRRSVRDFADRPVPMAVIENAIRAAGTAPSGANMQPWHFVVVTDPGKKREIRESAEQVERNFYEQRAPEEWLNALAPLATNASKPFLEIAPCLIAIFVKTMTQDKEGLLHKTYYPRESVGIATGILITALHLAGLVTLTYTPNPLRFLNKLLDRPAHEHPFLLLVTGYPADGAEVPVLEKYALEQIATFV